MTEIQMEETLLETQENTQNTPFQHSEGPESQALVEKEPWGRLYKKRLVRKRFGTTAIHSKTLYKDDDDTYFDIRGESYHFGRDPQTCDYVFQKDQGMDLKMWNRISKKHFGLYRDLVSVDGPICIKDTSRNGTFINGELIGHNQTRIIKSGDLISIIERDVEIFHFKDLVVRKMVDLPEEIQTKYFVGQKLGSGAFGEVYKLLDRKVQPYAVKYIKGCSLVSQTNSSENEIKIMKKLRHVCIIQTIDIMKDRMGGASLVLEYMEGGDLLNRIINNPKGRLSEDHSRFMFFQVTEAVTYLHNEGITHRDIKPDNVLLKDTSEWPLVKLTDFGLSKLVVEGTVMKSLIGTPNYVAPEILSSDVTKYTSKVDVWSMGVMLFAMLSGSLPFNDDYGDARKQILAGKYSFHEDLWSGTSSDARRLIKQMLVVKSELRLDIQDILETPWMDVTHEGVVRAIKIIEDYGGTLPHIRTNSRTIKHEKEHEFVLPRPPVKRPRHNL